MKKSTQLLFVCCFVFNASAQQIKNTSLSKTTLIKAAKEIMISTGTCALITQDKNGVSRVRMMDPFTPEKSLTLWFGTNPKSRKIAQIKNNNNVTVYYRDKDDSGYVMIYGKAELVNDQKSKKKYWKNTWKSFYPNKKESYVLIKVIPIRMEILSPPRNIIGSTETWEPPTLLFK
jgi:general stress protein 26